MPRRSRLHRRAAGVAMALILTAGCGGAGVKSEPAIGTGERSETVSALSFAAVTDGRGVATVVGTLLNEGEARDRLIGARAEARVGDVIAALPDGPISLPTSAPVQLAPRKGIMLVSPEFREGSLIHLTMKFARSPDITMKIPVEPQTGPYADIEVLRPADGDVAPPDA